MRVHKSRKKKVFEPHSTEPKSEVSAFINYIKENPRLSAVVAMFVIVCVIAGIAYQAYAKAKVRKDATAFANAFSVEDAALRTPELEAVAKSGGPLSSEALYMAGESAFAAKEYEKAKSAFTTLRDKYPNAEYTPDGVEGLGSIAEDENDLEAAIRSYEQIRVQWPGSFTAKRQNLNIARCYETLGKFAEAVSAYRAQLEAFPGSKTAENAQKALDRLRKGHPDLFAEETSVEPAPETPATEELAGDGAVAAAQEGGEPGSPPAVTEKPADEQGQTAPAEGAAPAEKPKTEGPAAEADKTVSTE